MIGYDQRGTGRSGLLRCPRLERDAQLRSTAAAPRTARRGSAPPAAITRPPDSVADMEAIRRRARRGAADAVRDLLRRRLALAYARAHPGLSRG